MGYPVFYVPAGDVLPIFFDTYDGGTGASVTMTGLAVTDIEIYKDGSVTQRASDAGYTLLDTDGIDFDAITGIHGFSIDTGDNTDAGFYTVGAWFTVVVSAITVDAQTVNFIACQFRLMPAESVAGKPKVDMDTISGSAVSTTTAQLGVNAVQAGGTAWGSGAITAASIAADAITAAKVAADVSAEIADAVLDEDMTGHQTQGSLGQAIGDPVADTNTIYKAVVSDATGATVGVDVVAVKSDTAAILTDTGTTLQAELDAIEAAVITNAAGVDIAADIIAIKAETAAILVDTGTTLDARIPAALVGGRMDASVGAMATSVVTADAIATDAIDFDAFAATAVTEIRSITSGTADSGTTTTMVDAARTEADTDYWKDMAILFTSGTISGQARLITAFNPTTDTITFSPAVTQAVGTNTYEIIPNVAAAGASAPTAAEVADAVWDEAQADHVAAGSFGVTASEIADVLVDTAVIGAAGAGLSAIPWNAAWDAEVESEVDDALGGGTGTALTAIPWNAAWDAEVQSEVDDALVAQRLDELLNADSDIDGLAPPTVGSVIHELLSKTAGSFTYDQTTDSLEAIRDKETDIETDTAEIGAAGAGLTNINLPNQTMDIVGNITGNLSGSVGSVTGAVGSVTGAVGSVTGAVGSVTGAVGSLAAQAKADVNAEVVDALNVDTYAEPGQGTPAATASLAAKINYLFKAWRNRTTQTATQYSLYGDDAVTVDQKATLSDDATTASRTEIVTGP